MKSWNIYTFTIDKVLNGPENGIFYTELDVDDYYFFMRFIVLRFVHKLDEQFSWLNDVFPFSYSSDLAYQRETGSTLIMLPEHGYIDYDKDNTDLFGRYKFLLHRDEKTGVELYVVYEVCVNYDKYSDKASLDYYRYYCSEGNKAHYYDDLEDYLDNFVSNNVKNRIIKIDKFWHNYFDETCEKIIRVVMENYRN